MGCGMGMIKYLLFIFNFIFAICGLAILIVGVLIHTEVDNLTHTVEFNVRIPSITLMVIGSIIFLISFFGCCGAIRESHCMTITFASFLLTILIIQVAIAIYAFVTLKNNDTGEISVDASYRKYFNNYWNNEENRKVIDVIQSSLECCGVKNSNDFRSFNGTIPASCCKTPENNVCTKDIFEYGCAEKIKVLLTYTGTVLGGLAIGIAAVELIGIIFALCLANSIKNAERRGYRV